MLNMMILASGSSLRICRINSKPETSGSLISITVMSGLLCMKAAIAGFGVSGALDLHGLVGSKQRPAARHDHRMVVDDQYFVANFRLSDIETAPISLI